MSYKGTVNIHGEYRHANDRVEAMGMEGTRAAPPHYHASVRDTMMKMIIFQVNHINNNALNTAD